MHQCTIQWIGDAIEMVQADSSIVAMAEPIGWVDFERIECFSKKIWEEGVITISDDSQQPIQAVSSEDFY